MTKTNMDLSELLAKHDQGDFLRSIAEAVLQLIMEADVDGLIGAGRHERNGERTTWRNGYRERALDTRLGTLNLRVPKLRQGSYFPGFLEARKTSEQALVAVIQEAWIGGVSTRRVDDLVQAMGLGRTSKAGNRYLRRLLYLGAMAQISARRCRRPGDDWLWRMLEKKPVKVVAVALANRMARVVWALIRSGESYRTNPA